MMKLILSFLLVIFSSCATSARWEPNYPAFEFQTWRICTKETDGEEKHLKGLCYKDHEIKKRFIRRNLMREKWFFCPWEDKVCLLKHALSGKKFKM